MLVVIARTAGAQPAPAPEYPETVVDRPLVMLPGMTAFDAAEELSSYVTTTVDAMGNMTSTRHLGHALELSMTHAVGAVQLSFDAIGIYLTGSAQVAIGDRSRVSVSFAWADPQATVHYYYGEHASYGYRYPLVEHRVALWAAANVYAAEEALTPTMAPASSGSILSASVGGAVEVQLTSRLAVDVTVGPELLLGKSAALMLDVPSTSLGGHIQVTQTFHHWDFYVWIADGDLTRGRRPYGAIGFEHRWGG